MNHNNEIVENDISSSLSYHDSDESNEDSLNDNPNYDFSDEDDSNNYSSDNNNSEKSNKKSSDSNSDALCKFCKIHPSMIGSEICINCIDKLCKICKNDMCIPSKTFCIKCKPIKKCTVCFTIVESDDSTLCSKCEEDNIRRKYIRNNRNHFMPGTNNFMPGTNNFGGPSRPRHLPNKIPHIHDDFRRPSNIYPHIDHESNNLARMDDRWTFNKNHLKAKCKMCEANEVYLEDLCFQCCEIKD